MKSLKKILHLVDNINEWTGKIASFLVFGLTFVIFLDTFLRYVFNSPLVWGMDAIKFQLMIYTCLGAGYCLLHGGHVKVDIVYEKFSLRTRAAIDSITHLLLLFYCVIIVKFGGAMAWKAFITGELTSGQYLEYKMWPLFSLIPITGVLLGLQALAKWIRDLIITITGENRLKSTVVSGEGGIRG